MYYFIKYYRYALLAVSLLLLVCGAVYIFNKRSLALTKLAAADYRIFRDKRLLSLLIFTLFLLNCFMVPLQMRQTAAAEISLNYTEASQGLNPNGTRYNQADILNPSVLERAIEIGAFHNITASDLKRVLSVTPKVQGNSYDESGYFISTQFVLAYQADKNTAHLEGETLLAVTAEAYKEWFLSEYSNNVSVLDLDFLEIEAEDYLDICVYLQKKCNAIITYMTVLAEREPAFQSSAAGETFQSVASQAENVSDVMVETLEAYILENSVSKAKASYMSRLSFQNIFSYFDALKADSSSRNNLSAISMYEDDMARIVLVPTYDKNYQFYMSQTRIGIDDFAMDADEYANEKAGINSNIAHNNHVLQQLSGQSALGPDGLDQKADLLVLQIENELGKLTDKAQTLVEEYNARQANKYITVTVAALENQAAAIAVNVLLYTLLFALAVHCAAFAVSMAGKSREQRERRGVRRLEEHEEEAQKAHAEGPVEKHGEGRMGKPAEGHEKAGIGSGVAYSR